MTPQPDAVRRKPDRQCRDGPEKLSHDLSQELGPQLASQVSAAHQQGPHSEHQERTTHLHASTEQHERQLDREEAHRLQVLQAFNEDRDAVTGLSSASRCTACTTAEARSNGEGEARRLACVRGSAEGVLPRWAHKTHVCHSTTEGLVYSNPEVPVRQRSDDTRGPDSDPSPSAWTRDPFAHEDVDDTETVALIGDGHAVGKKHGTCHEREPSTSRSDLEPSARSLRNDQSLRSHPAGCAE